MSPSQYQCPSGTIFDPIEGQESGGSCVTSEDDLVSVVTTSTTEVSSGWVLVIGIAIAFLLFNGRK